MHFASLPPWWLTVARRARRRGRRVRRLPPPAGAALEGAARRARRAARRRARSRSCWCSSVPLRCCLRPAIATRSCRCSSTSRAACAWRTPTAAPGSRARPRCCATTCCRCCRSSIRTELLSVGDSARAGVDRCADGAREPERPVRRAGVGPRTLPRPASGRRRRAVGWRRHLAAGGAGGRAAGAVSPWPVFAIGVGSAGGLRDREVLGIVAGEQRLEHASVDLQVSAVSSGFGRDAFQVRVLADGTAAREPPASCRPPTDRRSSSASPCSPTRGSRPCTPSKSRPADGEAVTENNTRSVIVSPAGRKRRLLVIEGAPGFEHTFVRRAWAADPGLEVDSVVRKGRDVNGSDTFLIQAEGSRAATLTAGFPGAARRSLRLRRRHRVATSRALSSRAHSWTMLADFVSERGGGLLVTGGRSFAQRGLVGHAARSGAAGRARRAARRDVSRRRRRARRRPTASSSRAEGETHPIMRLGASGEDTRRKWAALPALATAAPLGSARPGAVVLAAASAPGGAMFPIVAVQQLRPRPLDGVRRRSVVALADDGGLDRSKPRILLAADGPMAGRVLARSGRHLGSRCSSTRRFGRDRRGRARRGVCSRRRCRRQRHGGAAGWRSAAVDVPSRRGAAPAVSRPPSVRNARVCIMCEPKPDAPARRWADPIGGSTSAAATASSPIRASTRDSCGVLRASPAAATFARPTRRG